MVVFISKATNCKKGQKIYVGKQTNKKRYVGKQIVM